MCSCALQGVHSYSFFSHQKKKTTNQLLKFNREVCSAYSNYMSIQLIRQCQKHTSLWISTADLFWVVKKMNTHTHLARGDYTQWQLHFYCVLYIFASDCHVIFTVLPETQKLYLTAISHWAIHKMPEKKIGKLIFETTLIIYLPSISSTRSPVVTGQQKQFSANLC